MSQLTDLKRLVSEIANDIRKAEANLAAFEQQLARQNQRVVSSIGGSSQQKDKQVMAALQQASKAAKEARASLTNASKTASQYAASL